MRNFIELSEIPSFNLDLNNFIEWVNVDYNEYLQKLPLTENVKLKTIKEENQIKIYTTLINQNQKIKTEPDAPEELFNICVDVFDSISQNPDFLNLVDPNYYYYNYLPLFTNIKLLIPSTTISSWVFTFKKDASLQSYKFEDSVLISILLNDIDGNFTVKVNGEQKVLKQRGDYFIYKGDSELDISNSSSEARFYVATMDSINVDYKPLS
jgi:hypothetical protein